MRLSLILLLIFISVADSFCQKRNSVWCFGDSALVDFSNPFNIVTGLSSVKSRGSCVSISDTSGHLQFYAYTRAGVANNTTLVFNSSNLLIQGGDSIVGEGWYHELVILPFPDSDSLYYLFSIGVTGSSQAGLYYSIIDMSGNGGLGAVVQKNIQLKSFKMVDCLTAVRHGNGRDWWILFRKSQFPGGSNNAFYSYLISPAGVTNYSVQNVGSLNATNIGQMTFNSNGSKMVFLNYKGLLEMYDFDRCTGIISNPNTIYTENATNPWKKFWSAQFSPNDSLLYLTNIPEQIGDTSRLYQFDLTAPNIAASADTLRETMFMETMDDLKLAPDGKIYLATSYYQGYPYNDTVYNNINTHLSTVNSPDSLGTACDLQPYSFYLGGSRTYGGLPNNPDYDMGPVIGSACDSLRPVVNLIATDTAFCSNQCISFNDSSTKSPTQWQWFFTGAVPDTSTLQNPANICYISPGSYDVMLIACNEVGCDTLLLSNYINVYPLPVIELGNDTSTCNSPVQLDAGAGNTGYQWSNGETTQAIAADSSSLYMVTVTNANGCANSDSVLIMINPLPVVSLNAFAQDTLCITHGIQTISNGNPPGGSYTGTGVTGNLFDPNVAGIGLHYISYQYTDSLGCTKTVTDSVWVDLCMGISPPTLKWEEFYFTYVSDWQKLFVNAQGLKGRSFKMSVYDMVGNVIYTEEGKLSGQYFTRDLNMAAFAKGMYIVNFVTDKERLVKKFIKD